MKKMMMYALAVGLLLFSSIAVASPCTIDAPSLTEGQRSELVAKCEALQTPEAKARAAMAEAKATAEEATEWGIMAKEFASAIGIAARELGLATNVFLNSPAGKLVAALIIWKMAGMQLLGVLIGVPMIIAIWCIMFRLRRGVMIRSVEYTNTPVLWGLFTRRKETKVDYEQHLGEGAAFLAWALYPLAALGSTALILGTMIF